MNKVFLEYLDRFAIAFVDNIPTYSRFEEEYKKYPRLFLENLRREQLYTKFSVYFDCQVGF